MTTTPQPQVDIEELARVADQSRCADADQWAYSDLHTLLSPSMLLALIAETRALRSKAQGGGWIPVGERMPEPCKPVLFVSDGTTYSGNWGGGRVWWAEYEDSDDLHPEYDVTHWMPLPAPPEARIEAALGLKGL